MRLVRESAYNFHKTGDIKAGLDMGKYSIRDYTFTNKEEFTDYVISMIPEILGMKYIPIDIISSSYWYMEPRYATAIEDFLFNRNINYSGEFGNPSTSEMLYHKLKKMGYKENL